MLREGRDIMQLERSWLDSCWCGIWCSEDDSLFSFALQAMERGGVVMAIKERGGEVGKNRGRCGYVI